MLRRFGNMSAPTVLFVLQQVLRKPRKGPILVSALGPGFTAAFVTLLPQAATPSDELNEGNGIAALSSAAG